MSDILFIWTGSLQHDKWFKNIKIGENLIKSNTNFDFLAYNDITIDTKFDKYKTILIQNWCLYYLNNNKVNKILQNVFHNKSIYLVIYDIHPYTFDMRLYSDTISNNLHPNQLIDVYKSFERVLIKYNIKNIIGSYQCLESDNMIKHCKNINYNVLEHCIDPKTFNVFNTYDDKKYDILIFGAGVDTNNIYSKTYPVRNMIFNYLTRLSVENKDLTIKIMNEIEYNKLPSMISNSWITVVDCGFSDYLLQRYFEIPACKSVIMGNIPEQGKKIFKPGDYIDININHTYDEVSNIIIQNLNNKNKLKEISERMYNHIHSKFTFDEYNIKLNKIIS